MRQPNIFSLFTEQRLTQHDVTSEVDINQGCVEGQQKFHPTHTLALGWETVVARALPLLGTGILWGALPTILLMSPWLAEIPLVRATVHPLAGVAAFGSSLLVLAKPHIRLSMRSFLVLLSSYLISSALMQTPSVMINVPLRGTSLDMSRREWRSVNLGEMGSALVSRVLDLMTHAPRTAFGEHVPEWRIAVGLWINSAVGPFATEQYSQFGRSVTVGRTAESADLTRWRWAWALACVLSLLLLEPFIRIWPLTHVCKQTLPLRHMPAIALHGARLRLVYVGVSFIGIILPEVLANTVPIEGYLGLVRNMIGLPTVSPSVLAAVLATWDAYWLALFMACDLQLMAQLIPRSTRLDRA